MQTLNKIFLSVGLCLGLSAQAGSAFDSVPGDSSYPPKRVLLDLAKKCQVNPATAPQEWVNAVVGPENNQRFSKATQALSNQDDKSYQAAIQQMGCPINNQGTWSIN